MEINNERQKRLDYHKAYYQANKAKILEMGKKNVFCELCQYECQHYNFSKHLTTKWHIMMENQKKKDKLQKVELLDEVISKLRGGSEPIDVLLKYKDKLVHCAN